MVGFYLVLLSLLALERGVELLISRRNARWAFARGGRELGRGHFGLMKALHAGFLVSCAGEVLLLDRPFLPALAWPMLALALGAQALRYWSIFTLGRYWSVRVIVVPGARPVTAGPYLYLRHPNYLAVIVEGLAVPLVHTAWLTALAFTVLNGFLLNVRIRCEEEALLRLCSYRENFKELPRLIPWCRPGRGR